MLMQMYVVLISLSDNEASTLMLPQDQSCAGRNIDLFNLPRIDQWSEIEKQINQPAV